MITTMENWLVLFVSFAVAISGWFTVIVMIIQALRVRFWVSVSAEIKELSLVPDESRMLGFMGLTGFPAPDFTSHNIRVNYVYEYRNSAYEGSCVSIKDSVIGFALNRDKTLYLSLNQAMSSNKKIQVWVNPKRPTEAMITRRLYFWYLTVFTAFAGGGTYGVYYFKQFFSPWPTVIAMLFAVLAVIAQHFFGRKSFRKPIHGKR